MIRHHPLAAAMLACLVVMALAAWRALSLWQGAGIDLSGVPSVVWGFFAGIALAARLAFKSGQYHRGWMHARGIRQSHFKAIGGRH